MASDTEQQMQTLHFICISVFALTKNEIKVQNNFFNPFFSFLFYGYFVNCLSPLHISLEDLYVGMLVAFSHVMLATVSARLWPELGLVI